LALILSAALTADCDSVALLFLASQEEQGPDLPWSHRVGEVGAHFKPMNLKVPTFRLASSTAKWATRQFKTDH
jgi:hypothetical protein